MSEALTGTAFQEAVATALPIETPPGFWQREAVHAPQPWSPMMRIFLDLRTEAMRRPCEEFGALIETMEFREIGGWEYTRLVPFGSKDGPVPPAWVMWLFVRLMPSIRRRIKRCSNAVRNDLAGSLVQRWQEEWRPEFARRVKSLQQLDLGLFSDSELVKHMSACRAMLRESSEIHFLLGFLSYTQGELVFMCRDLFGWSETKTLEMLAGLSLMSTEPSRRLADLAAMARQRPRVMALLERLDDVDMDHLSAVDEGFDAAFRAYQAEYGFRSLRYEVADPTLSESPRLVLDLIRGQLSRNYDPETDADALRATREAVVAEARSALVGRPANQGERFERALVAAQQAYWVREDNEFYTISAPLALLRFACLELGRRLADRSQLNARDDVFRLEFDEALAALQDGVDRHETVSLRKAERIWVQQHPGPASFGLDPGPPPLIALPPVARRFHEALIWSNERDLGQVAVGEARREDSLGGLFGIAAAPGKYTGKVCLVRDESEFGKLQPGHVLVCPITSPVWSLLFPSVGALVTDNGGILSHSAIIAREYRVPAVVGTGHATEFFRDGETIEVDGAAGAVRRL
jgi:rifampicin phosphotransferase